MSSPPQLRSKLDDLLAEVTNNLDKHNLPDDLFEDCPLIVVDDEESNEEKDDEPLTPPRVVTNINFADPDTPVRVNRFTVEDMKVDPVFKHLFGFKAGTAESVFGQFTDEELFKDNRRIIPALIIASELEEADVIEIFTYLTDKRNMSLRCGSPRWTQSSKDAEWSLWNEMHTRAHQGYPRAHGISQLVLRAHMQRKENIPEEDEALAIAAGNKLQSVVNYILTRQRATVDLSFGGWLVLNITSSVKIFKQLLEHYIDTHDLIDYDYEEAELFQPIIMKLHEAPNTETRKAIMEEYIDGMREAKRDWKTQRAKVIKDLRAQYPDASDETIEGLLDPAIRFFRHD